MVSGNSYCYKMLNVFRTVFVNANFTLGVPVSATSFFGKICCLFGDVLLYVSQINKLAKLKNIFALHIIFFMKIT